VASTDYSGELSISDEILKRVVESYRRIRNTLRFLLANTSDFDPTKHAVPVAALVEIDRYMLAVTARMQDDVTKDYERYQFHLVAQKLQSFCSEDLGAFYLDILKDRLYTPRADSPARRSAQTALWHITQSLLRLMAPILSFTAEEAWQVFTKDDNDNVVFHTWHQIPDSRIDQAAIDAWQTVRQFREMVTKGIEERRASKQLGSSLQAEVDINASGPVYEALVRLQDDLRFVLLTSRATVRRLDGAPVSVDVSPSANPKCERCWHYRADVNAEGLCGRCVSNLQGPGEPRTYA
jgi:isoleucyl-tRNA synthetase